METRKKLIVRCAVELVTFSLFSLVLIGAMFHAAPLSFPFLAFLWTFFWFDVLQAVTLKRAGRKTKALFAAFAFFYAYFALSSFLCVFTLTSEFNRTAAIVLAANIVVCIPITIFAVVRVVRLWKTHVPALRAEFAERRKGRTGERAH